MDGRMDMIEAVLGGRAAVRAAFVEGRTLTGGGGGGGGGGTPPPLPTYATTVIGDGPTAYYRLQEVSGVAKDSSGNTNDATIVGLLTQASSPVGGTGSFAAHGFSASNYVQLPASPTYADDEALTIEFLMNLTGAPGCPVFLGATDPQRLLVECWSDGNLYFDDGDYLSGGRATAALTESQWNHIALVADPSAGELLIYIGGTLASSSAWTPGAETFASGVLGLWPGNANYGSGITGSLAEVALYKTALTADQILAHHDAIATP